MVSLFLSFFVTFAAVVCRYIPGMPGATIAILYKPFSHSTPLTLKILMEPHFGQRSDVRYCKGTPLIFGIPRAEELDLTLAGY
jgi:hypothetical protein